MIDITKIQFSKGLQYMPVLKSKLPVFKEWQQKEAKYDFTNAEAVGLVCGKLSGNLEALDLDLKYDLTGVLFKRFKKLVMQLNPQLLSKLVVQKTVSNGYHFIYRCSFIEGNQKLASRLANDEEKAKGDKVKVLLETRGEGGYIACYPTLGYELVYGDFTKIKTITTEERSVLINAAFSFNEILKPVVHYEVRQQKTIAGTSPIEDYNNRADVVSLLELHGWTAVGKKGQKILMKRPGDTKAEHSGNYDQEKCWFSVFSTSTQFESQTPYLPYAVFCILECGSDWRSVPKKLYDLGYGDREEEKKEVATKIPSIIEVDDDDLSFFAIEEDYNDYLNRWRTKTFEMGKGTGIPELDAHFLFKEGNLVIVNGIDNVGKSSVVWYLAMLSALQHGWNWVLFSSENRVGGIIRKLIEFYWCEPIDELTEAKYAIAKKFVIEHFSIIKTNDKMFNYQDILNMAKKALRFKDYKGLLIDPYNSLKVEIKAGSKQQIYDYHYEAASVIQLFAKHNNISIYLNCHVGTAGARNKDKQGYTKAPQKEDTEGGVMFSNKADEFITIHRVTQHQENWKFTELHIRKVKETETGGRVTYFHQPIDLIMVNSQSGFISVPDRKVWGSGTNAILAYHSRMSGMPIIDYSEPVKEQVNAQLVIENNSTGWANDISKEQSSLDFNDTGYSPISYEDYSVPF